MTPLEKIIISLSIETVKDMKLAISYDDVKIAEQANIIAQDAVLETPKTVYGIEIRSRALKVMEEHEQGKPSPYLPEPAYDMNALYDKTANASIKPIFEVIAKYAGPSLGRPMTKPTEESDKSLVEVNSKMSLEIFQVLNENKVPLVWIANVMQDLKAIIGDIDSMMKKQ